ESGGLAHLLGVDVGEGEGAAAQQSGELAGIDAVVLGLAAVDRLQAQRVAQDEGDAVLLAAVGNPVPGEQALAADHEPLTEGLGGSEEGFRGSGQVTAAAGLAVAGEDGPG